MSKWTDEETAIVLIGCAACMMDKEIAVELRNAGFHRSPNSIKNFRARLALPSATVVRAGRTVKELENITDARFSAEERSVKKTNKQGDEAFQRALLAAGYTPKFPDELYARSVPLRGSF